MAALLGGPLVAWKSAIAAVFAYFLYFLPWQSWGWSKQPWQLAAAIMPLIVIGETPNRGHSVSLLVVASFYVYLPYRPMEQSIEWVSDWSY